MKFNWQLYAVPRRTECPGNCESIWDVAFVLSTGRCIVSGNKVNLLTGFYYLPLFLCVVGAKHQSFDWVDTENGVMAWI